MLALAERALPVAALPPPPCFSLGRNGVVTLPKLTTESAASTADSPFGDAAARHAARSRRDPDAVRCALGLNGPGVHRRTERTWQVDHGPGFPESPVAAEAPRAHLAHAGAFVGGDAGRDRRQPHARPSVGRQARLRALDPVEKV